MRRVGGALLCGLGLLPLGAAAPAVESRELVVESRNANTCLIGSSEHWTADQREHCCKLVGRGCPYDCEAGLSRWEHGWSTSKKEWCCAHSSVGCTTTRAPTATSAQKHGPRAGDAVDAGRDAPTFSAPSYSCFAKDSAGGWRKPPSSRSVGRWSPSKREWCCKHEGIACEMTASAAPSTAASTSPSTTAPATTTDDGFDCAFEVPPSWSQKKKDYCCTTWSLGCSSDAAPPTAAPRSPPTAAPTTAAPRTTSTRAAVTSTTEAAAAPDTEARGDAYCSDEYDVSMWPQEKLNFCCVMKGVGCPTTPAPPPSTSTVATTSTRAPATSPAGESATAASTPAPFKCQGDPLDGWSSQKLDWCCKHMRIGCATTTTLRLATVGPSTTRYSSSQAPPPMTDEEKIAQLEAQMEMEEAAKSTTTTPYETFDCQAGYAHWTVWWSAQKKEWCCRMKQRGCPTTTAHVARDSNVSLAHATEGRHHDSKHGAAVSPSTDRHSELKFQRKDEEVPRVQASSSGDGRGHGAQLLATGAAAVFMGLVAAVVGLRAMSSVEEPKRASGLIRSVVQEQSTTDVEALLLQ